MRFYPILFSTPMVKALLAGRKTQTRRMIKESFNGCLTNGGPHPCPNDPVFVLKGETIASPYEGETDFVIDRTQAIFHCSTLDSTAYPICEVGDVLYVREEHYRYGYWETCTRKGKHGWQFVAEMPEDEILFATWPPEVFRVSRDRVDPSMPHWYKRNSLFMPKEAARIFLKVTDVRVEGLHDISEHDAIAEGINKWRYELNLMAYENYLEANGFYVGDIAAKTSFFSLWAKINGKESLGTNPWVWVYEFEKIDKPDALPKQ